MWYYLAETFYAVNSGDWMENLTGILDALHGLIVIDGTEVQFTQTALYQVQLLVQNIQPQLRSIDHFGAAAAADNSPLGAPIRMVTQLVRPPRDGN